VAIRRALKKCLRPLDAEVACARLRAVPRDDLGLLATAFIARGLNVHGVALEEDPAFARAYLPLLLREKDDGIGTLTKGPTLFLTERRLKAAISQNTSSSPASLRLLRPPQSAALEAALRGARLLGRRL
jgi:hypothetical protein